MRPGGRVSAGPPPLSIASFKKLCSELWGFEPTHPETAHMAAQELRERGFGWLPGGRRWKEYGLSDNERARAQVLYRRGAR